MKIAVSSVCGPPDDPKTWSNAPAHMIAVLEARGHTCVPIDSSFLSTLEKAAMAAGNVARRYPLNVVSWFAPARRKRGRHVAQIARAAKCNLVLCTSSLDAPVGHGIDYAIWLDNTFALLQRSAGALTYSKTAIAEIERLERTALNGACMLLPFSDHVRNSIIADYGVPAKRVHTIGCGSGPLHPFGGEKSFSQGHLLFVAKHLFASKGGDLLLQAFPHIRAQRSQTKLVLIGNEEARAKAGHIDGVEVHGYIERDILNRYFYEAAMLVQPMKADPWGQVYLEAMKARALVVGLNLAALPELTDDGRLGVLIDEPDPQKLSDAVLSTYRRSQNDLDTMTREAQDRVTLLYSWEAVAERAVAALGLERNEPME